MNTRNRYERIYGKYRWLTYSYVNAYRIKKITAKLIPRAIRGGAFDTKQAAVAITKRMAV